jgi:hypothetical protein
MEDYLTSLGSSMHASWHFGDFSHNEYPLGVGVMSDIIATSAGKNPWWITEMQGGPVTASGNKILCPSSQETKQAVWTGIFSGTKGVMFWTLNARKAVREAGEWALLDFAGGKSDRLEGISELASVIDREKDFFDGAVPAKSEVYILFSKESFWVLNENVGFGKTNAVSRSDGALAAPMIAAYKSLSASGLSPVIQDIASFDFDPSKTVVLPNVMALQDKDVERLVFRTFRGIDGIRPHERAFGDFKPRIGKPAHPQRQNAGAVLDEGADPIRQTSYFRVHVRRARYAAVRSVVGEHRAARVVEAARTVGVERDMRLFDDKAAVELGRVLEHQRGGEHAALRNADLDRTIVVHARRL